MLKGRDKIINYNKVKYSKAIGNIKSQHVISFKKSRFEKNNTGEMVT